MSKFEPKNRMEAYYWKFENELKLLKAFSILDDKENYIRKLQHLKDEIDICRFLLEREIKNG